MSDPRKDLASASSRERDSRCPGALNFIRKLRAEGATLEKPKPITESGTKIHDATTGEDVELTHSETLALETVEERLERFCKWVGVPDHAAVYVEKRLWLREGFTRIASGQPDRVFCWSNGRSVISAIPDFKTGWLAVESAKSNLQFRAYAVLDYVNRPGVEKVFVGPIPAHGKLPPPCVYNRDQLAQALEEWRAEIARCNEPDAPRIPGELQCRYCPAKVHCEKATKDATDLSTLTIHAPGLVVSDNELAALLDRCGMAQKVIGEIRAEAFRRAEQAPEIWKRLGWQINPGRKQETISDMATLLARLMETGLTAEEITKNATITKKALTEMLAAKTGTKGKKLAEKLAEILAGLVTETRAKGSLGRVGESE